MFLFTSYFSIILFSCIIQSRISERVYENNTLRLVLTDILNLSLSNRLTKPIATCVIIAKENTSKHDKKVLSSFVKLSHFILRHTSKVNATAQISATARSKVFDTKTDQS